MQDLDQQLAEVFEVTRVTDDAVLRDFEVWDSLTALSLLALAQSKYKATIHATELQGAVTIGDFKQLLLRKSAPGA